MASDLIRYEVTSSAGEDSAPSVATIVLDDPERRNALSDDLLDQLGVALDRAEADTAIRVVVLTSSHPRVFSSGGNLDAFGDGRPTIEKYHGLSRFPRLFEQLGAMSKPVVCAAGGDVLAGALGIALACDLVLIKRSARLGCPEINIGAFPFMISALIFRATGRLAANQLMMTGELISADEGRELGLVNKVFDDDEFDSSVSEYVANLAGKSPLLLGLGKKALAQTRDMPMCEALNYLQAQLAIAFTSEDLLEGVTAFKQKRSPQWSGR